MKNIFFKGLRMSALYLLTALLLLGSAGCGNQAGLQARAERIERNELVAAIGEEPEAGFDTATGGHGAFTRVIFSTLFTRNKDLGWDNDLAVDYQVSADRLAWTVKIRQDAKFTDGTLVTAEDVAYTFETAKNAGTDIDLTMMKSAEAVDEYTVRFNLNRPYSAFMEKMAYLGIVPKHAHGQGFQDSPIGSGPYKLVQWDKGQQVIFEANEDYYGVMPKIKKLTLVFLDTETAYLAVRKGDVDVAQINGVLAGRGGVQSTEAGTADELSKNEKQDGLAEGLKVIDLDSIECYGVCFPMAASEGRKTEDGVIIGNDVTSDIYIRKALNAAVDRQGIVDGIMNGYGSVSTTGLEKMPWLNEKTVLSAEEYGSLARAKEILAEGGWQDKDGDGIVEKNGKNAKFKLLYTDGMYRQEMALEFAETAKKIGIDVDIELKNWDTILPEIHSCAVLYGFGSGEPSELYNLYYGSGNSSIPWDNSGYYENEFVDECIDNALASADEAEALRYWQGLQEWASARGDVPYCWLANANHVYLTASGFSFGEPVVQPHGGRIFDNVCEWSWN